MTLINAIFLSFIGLASGFVVAAGIFAFITMLGIIPRLAQRTGTADHIYGYEWMIILGGTAGNILNLFVTHLPVGMIGLPIYGLFPAYLWDALRWRWRKISASSRFL